MKKWWWFPWSQKTIQRKINSNNKADIIIGIIVIAIALLGGVAFGSGVLTGGCGDKSVTIPNIVGMTLDNATKELKN